MKTGGICKPVISALSSLKVLQSHLPAPLPMKEESKLQFLAFSAHPRMFSEKVKKKRGRGYKIKACKILT